MLCISEEGTVHSGLGRIGDFLQEVALDLEQDWESAENVLNGNGNRNPLTQAMCFVKVLFSFKVNFLLKYNMHI